MSEEEGEVVNAARKRRCKECRQYITVGVAGKMIRICSKSGHPMDPEDECDLKEESFY